MSSKAPTPTIRHRTLVNCSMGLKRKERELLDPLSDRLSTLRGDAATEHPGGMQKIFFNLLLDLLVHCLQLLV